MNFGEEFCGWFGRHDEGGGIMVMTFRVILAQDFVQLS